MPEKKQAAFGIIALIALVGTAIVHAQLPAIAAGGLLHPRRHRTTHQTPPACDDVQFAGEGVTLRGWRCHASTDRPRATILYLHGIADNRGSAAGVIQRLTARGFDVIAYDSRAHGDSSGEACTYGYFEKRDLRRVVDTIRSRPVVLMGTSLGAAVALQEAADDRRVAAVVAAETFSDLRTVASERAPAILTRRTIDKAFRAAEKQGGLVVDDVSPANAASRITAPVLLLHGAADTETRPAHSQRVFAALHEPKELILVPGAGHNQSVTAAVWTQIEQWLEARVGLGS